MTSAVALHPLATLRRRLTFWYAATLGLTLLLLGSGLFWMIHAQLTKQLNDSLRDATKELVRAARIREMEAATTHGAVVDAVEELHIPDRALYIVNVAGVPVIPDTASHWVRDAAFRAATSLSVTEEVDVGNEHILSIHAERFRLASGQPLVAVVAADQVELADRYAALIAAFGGVALAALVLVAVGGYFLVQKATEPAERSMAYTRRFMADAAHELRTPIAVLRTKAEVALQEPRSEEQYAEALRGMGREAQRLGRVVDDLLMLARADAGERNVERTRFFLDDVVLDAAVSIRTLAHAAGVTLVVDEFEESAVVGDAALVRELMVVLLDNAVKFTAPGGSVRVSVSPAPQPTVVVVDTGSGIPPAQLPHVFERFYRGDASRSRAGGAGLGLSIAQWVAEAHDAQLAITSELGVGTRATLVFPAAVPV
ncbi:MAG: ATP-binding region ATPase domain protein [Gemmatimonadetes bacterium]|nr:ATP-binding region ATPase domain protein [Gemmatimonadota bacterium]